MAADSSAALLVAVASSSVFFLVAAFAALFSLWIAFFLAFFVALYAAALAKGGGLLARLTGSCWGPLLAAFVSSSWMIQFLQVLGLQPTHYSQGVILHWLGVFVVHIVIF